MSRRYGLGGSYFTRAFGGHFGPCEDERPTLCEAVDVVSAFADREANRARGVFIERREIRPSPDGGARDSPAARYTADGRRPYDFEHVARRLEQVGFDLEMPVYTPADHDVAVAPEEIARRLRYARQAQRDLLELAGVVARGIEEAERELARTIPADQ